MASPFVCKLEDASNFGFWYDVKGQNNYAKNCNTTTELQIDPIDQDRYAKAFSAVIDHIQNGNTYLLNLAFPFKISSNVTLTQIFESAKAPYKLYKKGDFVVFSPESFVQIKGEHIFAYPMKGTIDASIDNAREILLQSKKELWEHNTIVDLIRNDLSIIAHDVHVSNFRYIEKIRTNRHEILQTSSEIRGTLPLDWRQHFGELLIKLLPAGSISGAPKQRTVDIIESVEQVPRGYYTGIFGIFDGENFDSGVCIRFIEKNGEALYYKSGGGITFMSKEQEEYQELIDKIYVPTI